MFIFKKLITPFIVPPGIFIVFLILTGAWFIVGKNRKAGIVNLLTGLLLWLASVNPVSNALMRGLEAGFDIPKNPSGDVIIALGGGIYDQVPDFSGTGAPMEDAVVRIVTAARLQKKLKIPVIVTGGRIYKNMTAEAPVMKRFLVDLGVPAEKVITEEKSRDTFENAKYSYEICLKNGYSRPLLVTSAFHMKRSMWSFKKAGLESTPFPSGFRSWPKRQFNWGDFLPGTLEETAAAMKEYIGLVFYKLTQYDPTTCAVGSY